MTAGGLCLCPSGQVRYAGSKLAMNATISTFTRRLTLAASLAVIALHAPISRGQSPSSPPAAYGRIEVIHDTWGVPHVFSETDAGAMYGLGYATAQERGFQMHYSLRLIQGRLAEVLGERPSAVRPRESSVDHDRKMRTFGFYRAAQRIVGALDADTRALLTAYGQGVNRWFAEHREQWRPWFDKFGLEPEPWTPADCIASWWHLGQFFATDGTRELLAYRNLTQPERQAARRGGRGTPPPPDSLPAWNDDAAAVVGREDVTDDWLHRVNEFFRAHGLTREAAPGDGAAPKFSHAWVVGGKKTTTGAAVLVSDPQTPVRFPSLWQEFHVSGKTFNARGIGVPGSPALLIGWNEYVAWGATALGADQADLFRLQTDAAHPDQYFLDGEWRDMQVRRETIRVKGREPVEWTVRETRFGPVITPFAFAAPGDPEVALKRVPVCVTHRETIQAVFAMVRATNVASFTAAIAGWDFPSVNLVFGDRAGRIGYWLQAAIPLRSAEDAHQGRVALDGSTAASDWQGYVPQELLPHVLDPARGWIASANHRAIGAFYPAALGLSTGSAGHTVRSWRLYELLSARERFTPAEVLDVHFDAVNPARREIVRAGLHLRDGLKHELSSDARRALEVLEPWFAAGARSELTQPGGALAGEINTFFRFVSTPLAGKFGGGESGLSRFLRQLRARIEADPRAALDAEEAAFIDQALAGAWRAARQKYGDDPAQWDLRARAQVARRRLGWFDSLDGFGSLDPAHDLSLPALTCVDGGTIKSQAAQSYTQYVPLHEVDAARSLLPPGHSERPDDPAHASTRELWARGQLHPAPLSRAAVEHIAATRLGLAQPAAGRAPARLTLAREGNWLIIQGTRLPGGELRVNYLEAYCRAGSTEADWVQHTVIRHTNELLSLSADRKILRLRDTLADGLIVEHTITAGDDEVDFRLVARNPTARRSEAHWAQPCVRLGDFTGFGADLAQGHLNDYLPKCFLFLDGQLTRMPTPDWATQARYTPGQVWCPAGVPRTDVNPRPLNPRVPSHGLIGCFSADESLLLATAWEPYQELFQGVARCLHADFRLGGLAPGETKQIRGKIYLLPNDVPALLKRYAEDFPEHVQTPPPR